MLNKVQIIGNVGQAPIKRDANGTSVTNFSVACNERWNDRNTGERKERTEWIDVVTWQNLADICAQYLRKGSKVYVEGSFRTRKFTDQNNVEQRRTEVHAQTVRFLDPNPNGNGNGNGQPAPAPQQQQQAAPAPQQQQPVNQAQPQAQPAMDDGAYPADSDLPF